MPFRTFRCGSPWPSAGVADTATWDIYTGYGSSAPAGVTGQSGDTAGYTLATAFKVTALGHQLRKIRVYLSSAGGTITAAQLTNSGAHPLRANVYDGNPTDAGAWRGPHSELLLSNLTITTPTMDAWNEFTLATPLSLEVGWTYYAAITFPHGRYTSRSNEFASDVVVGPITFPADAATQNNAGSVRNGAYTNNGSGLTIEPPLGSFNDEWYCIDVETGVLTENGVTLQLVPWEGGPAYYADWSQPVASGMTSNSFFPLLVDFESVTSQGNIDADKAYNVNGYYRLTSDSSFSLIGTNSMIAFPGPGFGSPGNETVGWNIDDEVDMWANAGWTTWNGLRPGEGAGPNNNSGYDAMWQLTKVDGPQGPAVADGRIKHMNYGLGVVFRLERNEAKVFTNGGNSGDGRSFELDAASADAYFYTAVATESSQYLGIPAAAVHRANHYGKHVVKRVRDLQAIDGISQPVYGFVEIASQSTQVSQAGYTDDMIEGAVWACLIYEARGIIYFVHDFVYSGSAHNLRDNTGGHTARVTSLNSRITTLAPVLNTQSYRWTFNYSVASMLKKQGGYWYIFAMSHFQATHDTSSRSFRVPLAMPQSGTVEVVNESRSVSLSGGTFSDSFAAEYTCHIYKIAI